MGPALQLRSFGCILLAVILTNRREKKTTKKFEKMIAPDELCVAARETTAEVTKSRKLPEEEKLYAAARDGDVPKFRKCYEKHGLYLVIKATFEQSRTVLHIATKKEQLGVVEVILENAPELAECSDAQLSLALHIAAEGKNVEIVRKLLSVAPKMCRWRNCQLMNPIHVAVVNGRVQILDVLLQIDPLAARERAYRGKTVLHLCVECNQLDALQFLVEKLGDLVEAKDEDGNTILHLANSSNKPEMIQYLSRLPRSDAREQSDVTGKDVAIILAMAAMLLQATLTPPGGNWQDVLSTHRAGRAVMAFTHPRLSTLYQYAVSIGAGSSVISAPLTILGHLTKSFIVRKIVYGLMYLQLISIFFIFIISLRVIASDNVNSCFIFIAAGIVAIVISLVILHFLWKKRNTTPASHG